MKIYLVMGSSGGYSDFAEWPVKAFATEERATAFAESLPKIWVDLIKPTEADKIKATELYEEERQRWIDLRKTEPPHWMQPHTMSVSRMRAHDEMREKHDPAFCAHSEDATWDVCEIELED